MEGRRLEDLIRFYRLLDELKGRLGGARRLADCTGRMDWPRRGVYFFFEDGELRSGSGSGPRVVRVGTHGLKSGSKSTLWGRLRQHRGSQRSGGGNHRGSIFRLLVGASLLEREGIGCGSWSVGSSAPRHVREGEVGLERRVSTVLGSMMVLPLAVDDEPGPSSLRGVLERNAIALLSAAGRQGPDHPSQAWLGRSCPRPRVRDSGLWNQNHVDELYDPGFLDLLQRSVLSTAER